MDEKRNVITDEFLSQLKHNYQELLKSLRKKREAGTLLPPEERYLEYVEDPRVSRNEMSPMEWEYLNFLETEVRMRFISREMKEVEQLPSEIPKEYQEMENGTLVMKRDFQRLLQVVFPEAGGVLTYMEDKELPYKGFPYFESVEKIDTMKKISRGIGSGLFHAFKRRNKLTLSLLVFNAWLFKDFVRAGVYTFWRLIERFKIKTFRYSDSVRELHRAFSIPLRDERKEDTEFREQLRDLLCMLFELDNAYRFRFQDIIVELDKNKLKENPRKELLRLLLIMTNREKLQEIKDTWKLGKYAISFYLTFDRKMMKILSHALDNIDLLKVSLSPEDKQFSDKREDYAFGHVLVENNKHNNVNNLLY